MPGVTPDSIAARLSQLARGKPQEAAATPPRTPVGGSVSPVPKVPAAPVVPTVPTVSPTPSPPPSRAAASTLPAFGLADAGIAATTMRVVHPGSKGSSKVVAPKQQPAETPEGAAPAKGALNAKCLRQGGDGRVWEDATLAEWPDDDFRLFVGNLGNEVTTDVLARNFAKFGTFLKAKVIRDRMQKTKGFGFVSFKRADDALQAMREMEGKYIGQRPITIKRSKWQERGIESAKEASKLLHQQRKKRSQKYHYGCVPEAAPFEPYPSK